MKRSLFAAGFALATLIATGAAAETRLAGAYGGQTLDFSKLKPNSVVLSVMVTGKPASQQSAARSGGRRAIYVDGILMEMDEEMIVALIRSGIFTVVYPGTNIPWDKGEDRHPNYPPDWLPNI
ncbi:hypothetical protein DEA8626_02026 [Defluviimonas aquaemixtae]|uniref:Uncharacterized protein n=1 Tax=Albidovulum aquaemixtae TaxID=1542388 RepID=A0A2R8B786_9RHOB|nr:hypothetical protein [Defluviimonas aquaemixtae]SPH18487.1 hypothetical protein DEA8626_02026 [Defluviimonas aquaemixtae]